MTVVRFRRPRMRQWPVLLWLAVVWVALWGDVSWANVLAGAVVALLLTSLLPLPPLAGPGRLHVGGLVVLVVTFFRDLVISSWQIAWQAARPGPPPGTAVVAVQLRSGSPGLQVLTIELLSLVPGSLVVDLDLRTGVVYVHAVGVSDLDDVEEFRQRVLELEGRVMHAFEASPTRTPEARGADA